MKKNCFLSKCRYLDGVKCKKLIWYVVNARDKMPQWNEETRKVFEYGHLVGAKARQLFPNGIDLSEESNSFSDHINQSQQALKEYRPIFEGGYMADNCYCRVDIIQPVAHDSWDLLEVKCNNSVHEVNIRDAAWQKFCLEQSGLKINRCFIMHIKKGVWVKESTPPEIIFHKEDVTPRLTPFSLDLTQNIHEIRRVCAADEPPDVTPGPQCCVPYDCIMKPICTHI